MKLRTFIALEIPDTHKQTIIKYLNQWSKIYRDGINWVSPENLHLTLLFIGDTSSYEIQEIGKELFIALKQVSCFEMKCLGFELYPAKEPRLLWVKLGAEDESIFGLCKNLSKVLKRFDCQPDTKKLKLHITIGRIKSGLPVWLEQEFMMTELNKESALYREVTFYQSRLNPSGPIYTPLHKYYLR